MLHANEAIQLTDQNRVKALPPLDQLVDRCLAAIEDDIRTAAQEGSNYTSFSYPSVWLRDDVGVHDAIIQEALLEPLSSALKHSLEEHGYEYLCIGKHNFGDWRIKVVWQKKVDNGISSLPMAHERYGI